MKTEKNKWIFGTILIVFGVLCFFLFSCSEEKSEYRKVIDKYENLVYIKKDTSFTGIIQRIDLESIKRFGDFLYSQTNNVIVLSDTTEFSILIDGLSFNIEDTVVVDIKKLDKGLYETKTSVRKIHNEKSSSTLFIVKNLYYICRMNEELKNKNEK